jgi:integrase
VKKPPLKVTCDDIRAFLDDLVITYKVGVPTRKMYIAALKFLYMTTLKRSDLVEWIPWPRAPRHLPEILSPEEVSRIIEHAKTPLARVTISLAYGTGLRLEEVCQLGVRDIDSTRMAIHVHEGKGRRDRMVPLSPRLLDELRGWWRFRKPPGPRLFPGYLDNGRSVSASTVQAGFRAAVVGAGITKRVTFHSLRHAYATHLIESGTGITSVQALLGHATLQTTLLYLHVRSDHMVTIGSPLDRLPPNVPPTQAPHVGA